jgi:peroxiredoxin
MKKIAIQCMVYCLFTMAAHAQFSGPFRLNGTIADIADVDKVMIQYNSAEGKKIDTVKPQNGKYSFAGNINEPQMIGIKIFYGHLRYESGRAVEDPNAFALLYINPGTIEAISTKTFNNIKVSGTGVKWNKDFLDMEKQRKLIWESFNSKYSAAYKGLQKRKDRYDRKGLTDTYTAANRAKDADSIARIETESRNTGKLVEQNVQLPYIKANPSSPFSLTILNIYASGRQSDYHGAKALYESLSDEVKKMPSAQPFLRLMTQRAFMADGVMAPVFSLPDTLGKPISLESFRGKYVLIDFWGSFCHPCREKSPHLLKLYNAYKNKGFEILGLSLDDEMKKANWKKAIVEDKLTWPQVRDVSNVNGQYHVTSVPRSFLLNPQGIIIGQDLDDEELEAKLKELMK